MSWVQGSYDENYHNVLKIITGKPFTPYVQATFYEIAIRDVQCNNDGNSLYIRDGTKPVCLKEQTYENSAANPKIHDVRKTLGHELFHAMGIDHNSASNSIVYYSYVFGSSNGYVATTTDITDLGNRCP